MLEQGKSAESKARMENVGELRNAAREADQDGVSLSEFLDRASLVSDADGLDQAARALLMTIHAAKGLEFPAVVLTGMEESILPHQRSLGDRDAMEEERRLCYVGMTRARKHLYLTWARRRMQFANGEYASTEPSRFLSEIPAELLDERSGAGLDEPGAALFGRPARAARGGRHRSGPAPASAPSAAGLTARNSVAAVADFFKERGIRADLPPASPARRAPARPSQRPQRPPPKQPAAPVGQSPRPRPRLAFSAGARVRHRKFGVGIVRRREGDGANAKLTVYFRRYGIKKLIAGYAKLTEA